MVVAIWDWLFTRRVWTVKNEVAVYEDGESKIPCKRVYVLQDQFGNIKKKSVNF